MVLGTHCPLPSPLCRAVTRDSNEEEQSQLPQSGPQELGASSPLARHRVRLCPTGGWGTCQPPRANDLGQCSHRISVQVWQQHQAFIIWDPPRCLPVGDRWDVCYWGQHAWSVDPALNAEQTGLNRENQSQKASVGGTRGKSRINKIIVKNRYRNDGTQCLAAD